MYRGGSRILCEDVEGAPAPLPDGPKIFSNP